MKRNEHAMNQRMKTFGAAFCGIMLCTCMTVMSTGSVVAHAEQGSSDELAVLAATATRPVGWYATVTSPASISDPVTGDLVSVTPGSSALDSSGSWVNLSLYGVTGGGGKSYINEENLPALRSVVNFQDKPGASTGDIVWWELIERYEDTGSVNDTGVTENKKTDAKSPETEWTPDVSNAEGLPPAPEVTQKPAEPTPAESADPAPQEAVTNNQNVSTVESDILSLRCRESEADAKIAELEAQGYEIVRIEKLPKWWR